MSSPSRIFALVLVLASVLAGTMVWSQVPAAHAAAGDAVHVVVATHAEAKYSRSGWAEFVPLTLGKKLASEDVVEPSGQPVRVLCADLTEQIVTQLGPVPCPSARGVMEQGEEKVAAWQRAAPEDIMIPFVIAPRSTALLDPHPLIRWNPVPGVDGYRVTVRGEGLTWSTDVDDPEASQLVYPEDAPALEPGGAYTVEVVGVTFGAEGRSSAEEDAPGTSFTVLETEEAAEVQATVEAIAEAAENVRLAEVYYYLQNGLNAEALDLLLATAGDLLVEGCPTEDAESVPPPVAYLTLGDVYLDTGLEVYAGAAYACADVWAGRQEDLETQALAMIGLAHLALEDEARAEYAAEALALWEQLGAEDQIEALEEDLADAID